MLQRRLIHGLPSPESIFALSSAQGKAGVSVVRLSGPSCSGVLATTLDGDLASYLISKPNRLRRGTLWSHQNSIIDEAMIVYFKGPRSYTGEDVVEFHVHGSNAVVTALLSHLGSFEDCRAANPGEFSMRAFLNRKMNLMQVEALSDLLAAETEEQRRLAVYGLGEGPTKKVYDWRRDLIDCCANLEALIDFGEDENIEDTILERTKKRIANLYRQLSQNLKTDAGFEIVRSGMTIVIAGAPNAGKSSLLNRIASRKVAIVSPIAGTTRDVITVNIDLAGYPVVISDTAGIRSSPQDSIEKEGVDLAKEKMKDANLVLYLIDITDVGPNLISFLENLDINPSTTVFILSKCDSHTQEAMPLWAFLPPKYASCPIWKSSSIDATIFQQFEKNLVDQVKDRLKHLSVNMPVLSRLRHRECVQKVLVCLESFLRQEDVLLAAETLRQAAHGIGRISGHVDSDDIMDSIFSNFCIGK